MKPEQIDRIIEKLRKGENVGFLDNEELFQVAERLGADTSAANRLRGQGFRANALIGAIGAKLEEEKELENEFIR